MRTLARTSIGIVTGFLLLSGCSSLGGVIPGGGSSASSAASPAASEATSAPASGGSSDQSAADACLAIGSAMSEAGNTLQDAAQDFGSDPEKAVKALNEFKDSFVKASAKVDNPEVKAQVQKATDALTDMITKLEAGLNDPLKMTEAMSAMSTFQQEVTAISSLCG